MEEAHIPAAAELEKLCFSAPWSEGMLLGELNNPLSHYVAIIEGGALIGYAGMQAVLDEGYIANIAVHPDFRRQGAARAVMDELFRFARARELSFLTLEVRESNLPAIALYESFGFEKVGRRRRYYKLPTEDALLMTRFLRTERNEQA